MGKIGMFFDGLLEGLLSLIFSKEKIYERYLLILLLIGFILRLIASLNLAMLPDDAIYTSQAAGIIDSGIISTHSHPPLFSYMTDLSYKIFGYTTFAARFFVILPGTLLILLAYLLTYFFFKDKKIALFAGFFVTFSTFLTRMSFTEHSNLVFFFIFFAIYFGLLYLRNNKLSSLIISSVLFGLGMMTKYNAAFFIISFLIFTMYFIKQKKENIFTKTRIKHFLIFALIILLFSMPFLTFNYILYQEKGIVDFQFSQIFKTDKSQQLFAGMTGDRTLFSAIGDIGLGSLAIMWQSDLVIFIFALIGLLLLFKRKEVNALAFLLILIIASYILQSLGSPLLKHFVFLPFLFSIPAAYALNFLMHRIKLKSLKIIVLICLALLMMAFFGSSLGTPHAIFQESGLSQVKSFINSNVKSNELIVLDDRIYPSMSFWLATPNNLLLTSQFSQFYDINNNMSNRAPIKVYFVECAADQCGWGAAVSNPQLNSSREDFFTMIKNQSTKKSSFDFYNYEGNEFFKEKQKIEEYSIYTLTLNINSDLLKQTKQIQSFYFVPYMYLNMKGYTFDYSVWGFKATMNNFSLFMIKLAMVLALIFFFYSIIVLSNCDKHSLHQFRKETNEEFQENTNLIKS